MAVSVDGVLLRTLALRQYVHPLTYLTATGLSTKVVLLLLEVLPKTSYLIPSETAFGSESTTGIIGRAMYWWLIPFFALGSRKQLTLKDCYQLDRELRTKPLEEKLESKWNQSKFG